MREKTSFDLRPPSRRAGKGQNAKELAAPLDLVRYVHANGKLPVVNFAARGVATPADVALMMELGGGNGRAWKIKIQP